jgi:hypothetical protein
MLELWLEVGVIHMLYIYFYYAVKIKTHFIMLMYVFCSRSRHADVVPDAVQGGERSGAGQHVQAARP